MWITIPPPLVYQTSALPNELTDNLVPRSGFEPLPLACKTSTLPLRHRGKLSTGRDSNPRWSFDYGFAGRCIRHSTTCALKERKFQKSFGFVAKLEVWSKYLSQLLFLEPRTGIEPIYPDYKSGASPFMLTRHIFADWVGNDPTLLGLTDRRCTILASDPYIFADSIGFEPICPFQNASLAGKCDTSYANSPFNIFFVTTFSFLSKL